MSGANRVAVQAEQSIKRDVYRIGAFTCVGVAALFFLFFRSPVPFFLAMLPAAFGMLTGVTAAVVVLGGLDGLSIAFGAALVGVAIDYSIHVINHHALLGDRDSFETARRLAPSLLLGAGTTMASFAGLVMTTSPAIRELGFLSIVGIGAAVLATLTILPAFLRRRRSVPELSRQVAGLLQQAVDAMDRRRPALFALTTVIAAAGLLALPRLNWVDDLLDSEASVLGRGGCARPIRLPMFETGRFVISIGPDEEQALRTNDAVFERLSGLVGSDAVGGVRSLHQLLWSTELQQRNLEALQGANLREPLDRVFRQVGFRGGVFDGAFDDLESPPPPLTLSDLRESALGPMLSTLAMPIGDEFAIITYLRVSTLWTL